MQTAWGLSHLNEDLAIKTNTMIKIRFCLFQRKAFSNRKYFRLKIFSAKIIIFRCLVDTWKVILKTFLDVWFAPKIINTFT